MAAMRDNVPVQSIVEQLQALVRIPSRAGEDDLNHVCAAVEDWFRVHGTDFRTLTAAGAERLGVYAEARGKGDRPWTILNATLDTAAFGDRAAWTHAPDAAVIDGGWLQGRGSADSKAGVALFCHLLLEFMARSDFAGRVSVLFDCDEHSGRFGGARAFFDHPQGERGLPRPDGVFIGYPGMDRIVNGCRGFLRAELTVHGIAAHSGSSRHRGVNAIARAVDLSQRIESLPLPQATVRFPLPPQLTITSIRGGGAGFTQVPELCEIGLDVRLTPVFPLEAARDTIVELVRAFDAQSPGTAATDIDWKDGWPAYQLEPAHPLVLSLKDSARDELKFDLPVAVVGPSNIGNYLASLGVPALCGFGVRAEGIHAANERIALDSIEPVYRIYRRALMRLHRLPKPG